MVNSTADYLRISEILCSRLCHDLISPVSAINNGLEFLDPDDNEMFETSKALIADSGTQAINKLTFFRLAFGAAGDRESLGWGEVVKSTESYFRKDKIKVSYSVDISPEGGEIERLPAKVVLFSVILAADCLPRGGEILLESERINELAKFRILIEGQGCALRDDVRTGLISHLAPEELTVRNIIGYLAVVFAKEIGNELKIQEVGEDQIEITIA